MLYVLAAIVTVLIFRAIIKFGERLSDDDIAQKDNDDDDDDILYNAGRTQFL